MHSGKSFFADNGVQGTRRELLNWASWSDGRETDRTAGEIKVGKVLVGFRLARCKHFTSFGGVGGCFFLASCNAAFFCRQNALTADAFKDVRVFCSLFSSAIQIYLKSGHWWWHYHNVDEGTVSFEPWQAMSNDYYGKKGSHTTRDFCVTTPRFKLRNCWLFQVYDKFMHIKLSK